MAVEDTTIEVIGPDGTAPEVQQITRLDGRDFVLTFRYAFRTAGWHLTIDEYPAVRLVTGVRLKPGINFFDSVPSMGVLHLIRTDGQIASAGQLDFAEQRARIWYEPLAMPWVGMP